MDQANAAQLAARNIKAAKSRRRPIQSNPGAPQSMSFGGGDGGLFGGSVQATGTFNFSAPSGGLSFPPPTFGGNSAFGAPSSGASDSENEAGVGGDEDRRKKSFRGETGPATSTPVPSNTFGQNQQANPFTSTNGQSQQGNPFTSMNGQASNPFNFSQNTPQPPSPGLGAFNPAPKQDQPASSIFTFGGPPSQPAAPASSNIFGSTVSQDKPAGNLFGFNQPTSQSAQQTTPTFNFGSPAPSAMHEKPTNTPFSFPQSSTQSSSPGIFGSAPATQAPAANIFGNSQPSSPGINFGTVPAAEKPVTNIFGTSQLPQSTSSAPSTNIFAHLNTPADPSTHLFGGQQESKSAATPSTLFGGQAQQSSTTSNLFGNASQTPPNPNSFEKQNPVTSSTSLFSNLKTTAPSTSNLFGSPKPAPTNNLFGGTPTSSDNDLFGNLNKPVDQPAASQPKINGTPLDGAGSDVKSAERSTSLLSNTTPQSNLFGNSSSMVGSPSLYQWSNSNSSTQASVPSPQAEITKTGPSPTFQFGASQPAASNAETNSKSSPAFSFGSLQPSAPTPKINGNTPSSPMKPMDAPSSASQPPPSGMFPSLPPPTPKKPNDVSSKPQASTASTTTNTERPSNALVNGNAKANVDYDSLYAEMDAASAITDEQLASVVPARFSDIQKNEFFTAYRLRSLNKAVEKFFGSVTFSTGISGLIAYYNEKKVEILDRSSLPIPGSKRKATDHEDEANDNHPKRSRQDAAQNPNFFQAQSAIAASKRTNSSDDEDQENENPNKRSRQDAAPSSNFFQAQAAPKRSKPSDDEDQENENPNKRSRPAAALGSEFFQPQSKAQTTRNPEKSTSQNKAQPYLNGSTASSLGPSLHFTPQTASPNLAALTSPSTKGRETELQMTKLAHEREEQEETQLKSPTLEAGSGRSNTSNIFKNIVDSPAKENPEKKVVPLPRSTSPSKDDAPRANPFGTLPVPKSPTKPAPSQSSTARFTFTPTSNATSNVFSPTSTYNAPKPFSPKPAPTGPTASDSAAAGSNTMKPPTWNLGGGNFMAQFAEDSERQRMERAKEEDMDSDEDEQEWEANWKAKERAKKKELEDLSRNGKGFVFAAKKSDSPNSSLTRSSSQSPVQAEISQSVTAPTSLFGQPIQSSGNSAFGSRASTPGAFGSSTGSVLDDHATGQPLIGGMFAHLSDVDSGADSGQADEDSPSGSDGEEDSENKDPNYDPGEDSGSGPGTPVEETGAGIASAKKETSTTPFLSGFSTLNGGSGSISGTSSPGRSLFDRVTRDSNGNPVRQLPADNQETTLPPASMSAPNPFASLSRTSPAPTNQTWNPHSPILFGNTTPTPIGTTNPTVSITEATPTKTATSNLFGNLNNSGSTSNTPFSGFGLFGSNSNALASGGSTPGGVGYSFGGQPSTTSSLFPSAAVSTATSRATSPGNTTDGDSAAEDPDAEKHEQLDLTAGGPGEEDEEVVHSVRAKATKFIPKEGDTASSWKPMGVGPLRLLKHKETGAARLVLRADPRGQIVLNKSLLAKVDYKPDNKTVKFLAASDGGNGLETWILQVKTAEMAEALAEVMDSNKPS